MKEETFECSATRLNRGLARIDVERIGDDQIRVSQWLAHPITGEYGEPYPSASFTISRLCAPEMFLSIIRSNKPGRNKITTYEDKGGGHPSQAKRIVQIECRELEECWEIAEIRLQDVDCESGVVEQSEAIYLPADDIHKFAWAIMDCWSDSDQTAETA